MRFEDPGLVSPLLYSVEMLGHEYAELETSKNLNQASSPPALLSSSQDSCTSRKYQDQYWIKSAQHQIAVPMKSTTTGGDREFGVVLQHTSLLASSNSIFI
jgi:hypothetical protein